MGTCPSHSLYHRAWDGKHVCRIELGVSPPLLDYGQIIFSDTIALLSEKWDNKILILQSYEARFYDTKRRDRFVKADTHVDY